MIEDHMSLKRKRESMDTCESPEINKQWKQLVMDQLKHHYKIFTNENDNNILINYRSGYSDWKYIYKDNLRPKLFLKYINYKTDCKNVD